MKLLSPRDVVVALVAMSATLGAVSAAHVLSFPRRPLTGTACP